MYFPMNTDAIHMIDRFAKIASGIFEFEYQEGQADTRPVSEHRVPEDGVYQHLTANFRVPNYHLQFEAYGENTNHPNPEPLPQSGHFSANDIRFYTSDSWSDEKIRKVMVAAMYLADTLKFEETPDA